MYYYGEEKQKHMAWSVIRFCFTLIADFIKAFCIYILFNERLWGVLLEMVFATIKLFFQLALIVTGITLLGAMFGVDGD